MPGRQNNMGSYRYGYNGMEIDPEFKGNGNQYTTEFRQYDPRLGRWMSLDPLMHQFPHESPYCAFGNNPVFYTDPSGLQAEGGGDDFGRKGKKAAKKAENGADKMLVMGITSLIGTEVDPIELEEIVILGTSRGITKLGKKANYFSNPAGAYPYNKDIYDEYDMEIARNGIESYKPRPQVLPDHAMQWEKDLAEYSYGVRVENWENASQEDKWQSTRQSIILNGLAAEAQAEVAPVAELYKVQATLGGSGMATGGPALSGVTTKVTTSTEITETVLRSFEDILANPTEIWGKSADEVAEILGEGWTKADLNSGEGWKFTKGDKFVSYTTGNSHHPNSIYYKINSSAGKNKVVGRNYHATPGDKHVIHQAE